MRARRGDETAANAFVRATQADVWRLMAALSSPREAEDLTQETYVRAFASLHRFAGRSSARTWLLSIARRVCADAIRGKRTDRLLLSTTTDTTQVTELVDKSRRSTLGNPAETARVNALLAGLHPQRREAFILTQLVGLSYAEAAEVCHCPVGTIRSRVARAREDLIAAYTADDGATATGAPS